MADVGAAYSPFTEDDGWFLGEDKTLEWVLDDGTVGNAPTGTGTWTLEWVLRQTPESPTAILTKTPTFADPARIQVEIDRDDTKDLPAGTYHYTLAKTNSGSYQDLAYGPAEILQPSTR